MHACVIAITPESRATELQWCFLEKHVVSQCANPSCGEPFLYLRNGRLFTLPRHNATATHSNIEYFWLCATCAEKLEPRFAGHYHHVTLVERRKATSALGFDSASRS